MAVPSYKLNDRRGTGSGWSYFNTAARGFSAASKSSIKREQYAPADRDSYALLNGWDRISLMTVGRHLYQNDPTVFGCLNQMAEHATEIVQPQYDGENSEWGKAAENWLYDNDRWIDVRGVPFTMADDDFLIVLHVIRDGDVGILLTENEQGDPKIQLIPAHRIGTRGNVGKMRITEGQFEGATIIDGVIVGDSMETLGYRVLGETKDQDKDFSVNDMRLIFKPLYADQVRGFSWLACAAISVQDVHEARKLELISQKTFAGRAFIEHTETGEADGGVGEIVQPGVDATSTTEAVAPKFTTNIEEGETTYYRAGSQSKLEAVTADRPTMNQQAFKADTIRHAIHGLGWSVDYWLDPTQAGGAQMRVVLSGINDTCRSIRERIVSKVRKWIDPWRIAKAIKAGRLPEDNDWWRWEYQFAAKKTADAKYDSDVALQEMRAGITTQKNVCAARGLWNEDVSKQKKNEAIVLLTDASELSEKFGISISEALNLLAMPTPTGAQVTVSESTSTTDSEQ